MQTVLTFLLRLLIVAAGLVFAVSLAAAFAVMIGVWGLRAAWARLTGRPVVPFIIPINPQDILRQMYRRARPASPTPRAAAARPRREPGDVTDVEPRPPA